MTDNKKATEIEDQDLDQAEGGAGYLKIGDIKGESVNSYDLTLKRGTHEAAGDAVPVEDFSMNFEKIKHKY